MTDWREGMRTCAFSELSKQAQKDALSYWCDRLAYDGGFGEYKCLNEDVVKEMLMEHDFMFYENGVPVGW